MFIHSKKSGKLEHSRASHVVYVLSNLWLVSHVKSLGYYEDCTEWDDDVAQPV